MSDVHDLMTRAASHVELIDHHGVEWGRVRHTRYWMVQRFLYRYPGPVREIRQRLMVAPPDRYGDQVLRAFNLHISAPDATTTTAMDAFGNRVLHVHVPYVDSEVSFETRLVAERHADGMGRLRIPTDEALRFRAPTPLTAVDARIAAIARELVWRHSEPEEFAEAVNAWVYRAMRYRHGATTVQTSASEALAVGHGLCQDYSHIMLAICRAAGLPARYVSGHMLGEGGSHAWVEVLLWDGHGGYHPVAFDPTNHRRATPAYITVSVGRDYRDVSPTTGSFIAPYPGHLTTSKRAGLTDLEYHPW